MTQHIVVRNKPFYKGVTKDLKSPMQTSGRLVYTPGTTVTADSLDVDPDKDCGHGINFSSTIAGALRWGPVVVSLSVPSKAKVIDAGNKLRAASVTVIEVIDLSRADLTRAYGTPSTGASAGWALVNGYWQRAQ